MYQSYLKHWKQNPAACRKTALKVLQFSTQCSNSMSTTLTDSRAPTISHSYASVQSLSYIRYHHHIYQPVRCWHLLSHCTLYHMICGRKLELTNFKSILCTKLAMRNNCMLYKAVFLDVPLNRMWNSLPIEVVTVNNVDDFKTKLLHTCTQLHS